MRAGFREGSVITAPDAVETIESPDVWNELRRELEDVGLTPALMEEHRQYITSWMKSYLLQGGKGDASPDRLDLPSPLISRSSYAASSSTITVVASNEDEFEAKVRQQQPSDDVLLPSLPLKKKNPLDPSRMVRKLFHKQTAIVQAASDGDMDKIANLISLGCNVNATDRWG